VYLVVLHVATANQAQLKAANNFKNNIMPQIIKTVLIFIFLTIICCTSAHFALAADTELGLEYGEMTGLGQEDPRIIVANIIRIILGFLGIIAVGLIVYAGWLWMSAEGNSEKVEQAKKILIGAIIGLIIALSAFAIASFILSQILEATGSDGTSSGGGTIGNESPGGGYSTLTRCDANTLTPTCDIDSGLCDDDEYCGDDCYCYDKGGYGDFCDGDVLTPECEASNNMCQAYLECKSEQDCKCLGAPVIEWISPIDIDNTPNGASGNFITIGGRYFDNVVGEVVFAGTDTNNDGNLFGDADDRVASFPNEVNSNCVDYWLDSQIIIIVPDEAIDGPIKVTRADNESDTTIDSRGPIINDFDVNDMIRPGLCLAEPNQGYFGDSFSLEGISFDGTEKNVFFGNETNNVVANNISDWTGTSVKATVPNIDIGKNSIFINIDEKNSNSLIFETLYDYINNPTIDYINPDRGPTGQYITIYGSNFKIYSVSSSLVHFYSPADPNNLIYADIDFVEECREKFWHDTYITVKVPDGIDLGEYKIIVTNRDGHVSEPANFTIIRGEAGPGICLLEPHNGPTGQTINVYGDNFENTQDNGQAVFYNDINSTVFNVWTNQNIEMQIPTGSQTGPFKVIKNGVNSNTLQFTVGTCSASDQCELGEECCSSGTYWAGICRSEGECSGSDSSTCGFGWNFSTTSNDYILNCSGYTTTEACISTDMCPNSPGQCQTRDEASVGMCGNDYCNNNYTECSNNCIYDVDINKCKINNQSCDKTSGSLISGYLAECRLVNNQSIWQINSGETSCPIGSFLDTNNWCSVGVLGTPEECDLCDSGFECQNNQCAIDDEICPDDSTCNNNECILGNSVCECCCRVGYDAQDCCAGLTCNAGNCGSGAPDYGLCTGCRVIIDGQVNQVVSDQACNCYGQPNRYCEINDFDYPLGVCLDQAMQGESCDADIASASCQANDSVCLDGLYCDVINCTCQPGGSFGDSCDSDLDQLICQADNDMCQTGLYCDEASCTCQAGGGGSGDQCQNEGIVACATGELSCLAGLECLDEDGDDCRCCCNPNNDNCAAPLSCWANQSPCDSEDRGLCCGCSSDSQCSGGIDGCGNDTCCHVRPEIAQTIPVNNATNVCRNILINATFDQEMDTASFTNNFIVIGDYGENQCPAGTNFLASENKIKYKFIAKIVKIFEPIFGERIVALASENHNYCSIEGTVGGYNNQDGVGLITFTPTNVLDANILHYAIIKGDDNITDDLSTGVLSTHSIGMFGQANDSFNAKQFINSKIWSFTVGQDICQLNNIVIDPLSYLFQTAYDNPTDNNSTLVGYDTEKDGDKVFYAQTLNSLGEAIVPFSGLYSWTWDWQIDNDAVVDFANGNQVINSSQQTILAQNQQDAKTTIYAEATISEDIVISPSTIGQKKIGEADAYVFLCANPWPPTDSTNYWAPWRDSADNCSSGLEGTSCINNNFELYYCRDTGDIGTADDLPAILKDTVIRGYSENLDLLKEYYFLREDMPLTTVITASDQQTGGKVVTSWLPVTGADGYKLYYGKNSGNYDNFLDVGNVTSKIISGLTNGQIYYFTVTAYYNTKAESSYSNETSVIPTDSTPPSLIVDLNGSAGNMEANLDWSEQEDAIKYKIYYGTASGLYGDTAEVNTDSTCENNDCNYKLINLINGINYYITVTAIDAYENESDKSNEIELTPISN